MPLASAHYTPGSGHDDRAITITMTRTRMLPALPPALLLSHVVAAKKSDSGSCCRRSKRQGSSPFSLLR
eukprot:CAMPEP_0177745024 /NCGR_PEP_ID=MMETSP0484_2-20121128/30078_1 /TAXON_ID=354590 /ORGANISM="Rhodomonas lens, Strain RHODO" /LENGTH=68 /DNA_ID=CAMNT_0019259605 /DNA_START=113 /DNA_END=315 /DNA_ORIENTATION=-